MPWKCVFAKETTIVRRHARAFIYRNNHSCNEMNLIEDGPAIFQTRPDKAKVLDFQPLISLDDPRWPKECKTCGYKFDKEDYEIFQDLLYDVDGKLMTIKELPIGAIWNAWWLSDIPDFKGPDGMSLMCKLPTGHEWCIDGRASNCTMKEDHVHKCWVRHGTPPDLTVDKNGHTCAAGAGSILVPGYHGFLRNGYLTDNC